MNKAMQELIDWAISLQYNQQQCIDWIVIKDKAEQLKEIEKQQIKDAYNQGFRDGLQDCKTCGKVWAMDLDVEEHSNADDYYNENFNK